MTTISMTLLAYPLHYKARRGGVALTHRTYERSKNRQKLSQLNSTKTSGWNNVCVTRVIPNSHKAPRKYGMQTSCGAMQAKECLTLFLLLPLYPFFGTIGLLCSLLAVHLLGGTLPRRVFDLLLFGVVKFNVIPLCFLYVHATFYHPIL